MSRIKNSNGIIIYGARITTSLNWLTTSGHNLNRTFVRILWMQLHLRDVLVTSKPFTEKYEVLHCPMNNPNCNLKLVYTKNAPYLNHIFISYNKIHTFVENL